MCIMLESIYIYLAYVVVANNHTYTHTHNILNQHKVTAHILEMRAHTQSCKRDELIPHNCM